MSKLQLKSNDLAAINEYLKEVRNYLGKNIVAIKMYGSKVMGTATEESDIDLLLILKKINDRRKIVRILSDLESKMNIKYGVLISTYPIEENYYNENNNLPFIREVNRYGIAL